MTYLYLQWCFLMSRKKYLSFLQYSLINNSCGDVFLHWRDPILGRETQSLEDAYEEYDYRLASALLLEDTFDIHYRQNAFLDTSTPGVVNFVDKVLVGMEEYPRMYCANALDVFAVIFLGRPLPSARWVVSVYLSLLRLSYIVKRDILDWLWISLAFQMPWFHNCNMAWWFVSCRRSWF